ncbi:hypothetical protein [Roseibium sp.]
MQTPADAGPLTTLFPVLLLESSKQEAPIDLWMAVSAVSGIRRF